MEPACGSDHRNRGLFGGARRKLVADERGQRALEGVVDLDLSAVADRLRAHRCDAGFECPRQQPVPQFAGRPAVVAVVLLDLLEQHRRLVGPAVIAQFAVAGVLGDRVGGGGDLARAQVRAHVQRLERLEAVILRAYPNALAYQREKVDQHAVAQQVVDVVLADAVVPGQPQQRRLLVGGVMVDVHVRVPAATFAHHRQEILQRAAFLVAVVRPQRVEAVSRVEYPEQILQAPAAAVGGPQRVALEVEEQVPTVGVGQQRQRLRVGDLVGRFAVLARRDLQPGLGGERADHPVRQVVHRAVVCRQRGGGGDPGVDQPGPLADPHVGHQQQVVGLADHDGAFRAAEACAHAVIRPAHRPVRGVVIVEQALQLGTPAAVHRDQFVDAVARHRAVAQHQFGFVGDGHAGLGQRVGVGGELQECLDLGRPGEFGVAHPVALVVEDQEVGEPDEPAVEHRGLIDQPGAGVDCPGGCLGRRRQARDGVRGHRPADDGDIAVGLVPQNDRGGAVRARRPGWRCGPAVRLRRKPRGRGRAWRRRPAAARIRTAPPPRGRRHCR